MSFFTRTSPENRSLLVSKGGKSMSPVVALLVLALSIAAPAAAQAPQARAALQLVFVWDGLRPDSITAADTPNLYRLRAEGVTFAHSHAVFPTVTRVNAASL